MNNNFTNLHISGNGGFGTRAPGSQPEQQLRRGTRIRRRVVLNSTYNPTWSDEDSDLEVDPSVLHYQHGNRGNSYYESSASEDSQNSCSEASSDEEYVQPENDSSPDPEEIDSSLEYDSSPDLDDDDDDDFILGDEGPDEYDDDMYDDADDEDALWE